jgi:Predicted xylanase/chitin deacetylase
MHDIPEHQHENFKSKIKHISKKWNFISTEDLKNHFSGKNKLIGRNVLLTFDDGFKSNRIIADKILDPLGIKALFFIIGNFVEQYSKENQLNFIKENLYPEWRGHDYPPNIDEMENMDIDDLKHLINKGHSVGFHSSNHRNLSEIELKSHLESEIVDGALALEKKLDQKIKHFSFGYGNINFFSKNALKVAHKHFDFIYTGMRGITCKILLCGH